MIRDHEGCRLINPRHIVALEIGQDTATLKWCVWAAVEGYSSSVLMGVFDSAMGADNGASRLGDRIERSYK
jgi:hypothetical protein